MKIVIAPDSFKESLSARAVAQAIAQGLLQEKPHAHIVLLPMADGGEGTVEVLAQTRQGQIRQANVVDALGRACQATWLWLPDQHAVIEMASAAGLDQIAPEDRDVLKANTLGVGQLILQALEAGATRITLTAGGSATNDAGMGMLHALGMRFKDAQGRELNPTPNHLADVHTIDVEGFDPRLSQMDWTLITDVSNPLYGPNGASVIFGPQKGATPIQVQRLDAALQHFSTVTQQHKGQDWSTQPGAGAAGGFAFAALAWLGADLQPGASWMARQIRLDEHIQDADLVITGEGRIDAQTAQGKAPFEVIQRAKAHQVPVIALAGTLGPGYQALYDHGLLAAYSLVNGPMTLDQAVSQTAVLLRDRARDLIRTFTRSQIGPLTRHSSE